jgi:hypothetical protein
MRNMYQNIELKRLNKKGKKIMEKKIFLCPLSERIELKNQKGHI